MWILSKSIDQANFDFNGINELALFCLICGFIIILLAVNKFREAKTTIHPRTPNKTSFLVHKGIYKHTRNPMYLGLVLILVSVAFCGPIVRSTDNGSSWDNVTSPTSRGLSAVGFGNNTFVVVGINFLSSPPPILRSTDNGSSWDNVTSPTPNGLNGVTF